MVDVSGAKPIDSAVSRIAATTPVAATPPVSAPAVSTAAPDMARTGGLAASMAASAPIDADRIAVIREAIAEGRFPILPATIADRLIALGLQWNSNGDGSHGNDDQA